MTDVRLVVQRFNPVVDPEPQLAEYAIPRREGMTVLDALLYARDYLDHSIAVSVAYGTRTVILAVFGVVSG